MVSKQNDKVCKEPPTTIWSCFSTTLNANLENIIAFKYATWIHESWCQHIWWSCTFSHLCVIMYSNWYLGMFARVKNVGPIQISGHICVARASFRPIWPIRPNWAPLLWEWAGRLWHLPASEWSLPDSSSMPGWLKRHCLSQASACNACKAHMSGTVPESGLALG